eukprot:6337555-Ditylum_brightwellii.AAC.1
MQPHNLPQDLCGLNSFFPCIKNPTAKQNWTAWTAVQMGSNKDFWQCVIKGQDSEMTWFYETYGGGLFKRTLENVKRLVTIGYAVYSSNFVDPEAVKAIIHRAYVENGFKWEVGVKLKKIPRNLVPGTDIKYDVPPNSSWFTCHWMVIIFEADQGRAYQTKKQLYHLFNCCNALQPGGLPFRVVPAPTHTTLSRITGPSKFVISWKKHCSELDKLDVLKTIDILSLDNPVLVDGKQKTLCKYMMKMRHLNGTKVFHHIDKAWYFKDPTGLLKVVA